MSQIIYLNQVHIAFGALSHLQNSCTQHQIDHALIVTDPGIRAAGILDRVLRQWAAAGLRVSIFDQTPSNPTERAVHAARAIYVDQGCNGLIALGGGSALGCAGQFQEIAQNIVPMGGSDALRMELHAIEIFSFIHHASNWC